MDSCQLEDAWLLEVHTLDQQDFVLAGPMWSDQQKPKLNWLGYGVLPAGGRLAAGGSYSGPAGLCPVWFYLV